MTRASRLAFWLATVALADLSAVLTELKRGS